MSGPTLVRMEYWNETERCWRVGHSGINLMDPQKYVDKMMERKVIGRAVVFDTGETLYADGGDLL